MNGPLTSKLPDVGTTIFTVMSQLAQDCRAINLSQGFPGFEPPAELIDRIDHYLRSGANQYAPMPGVPSLRRAIAGKVQRMQKRTLDTETEITVCTGATEGLFSAIQALVRNGDEVIVPVFFQCHGTGLIWPELRNQDQPRRVVPSRPSR